MLTEVQLADLLDLLRRRYPNWDGFDHAPFVADELAYKRAASASAADLLGPAPLADLLAGWQYDEVISRLERLGKANNMLWNRVPKQGDLAMLYQPDLPRAEFCLQLRDFLYGADPAPVRLAVFGDFLLRHNLPFKWAFPTYFLFLARPEACLYFRPGLARWFLRFLGEGALYASRPTAAAYAALLKGAAALRDGLAQYRPVDMIDIQSLLWVAMRESEARISGLTVRGQVELGVPVEVETETETEMEIQEEARPELVLAEPEVEYEVGERLPAYDLSTWAADSGVAAAELARWVRAVQRKGQAIFYGPPGTGKTYLARGLARHLVGGGDGLVEVVQFHPAYAYEDFIQGIRPRTVNGSVTYELAPGRFLSFCAAAAGRSDACVLIIDEINRANLSQVFGELMYLLEYRAESVNLAGGTRLAIPPNVYLIGTMNTADRSIALVDTALRRRFAFIRLEPDFDRLRHFHRDTDFNPEPLIRLLGRVNAEIDDPHYALGITFFMRADIAAQLADIWQMEIEPYLEEYFFDRPERLAPFRWVAIATAVAPGTK